jgi:hypothetical protein
LNEVIPSPPLSGVFGMSQAVMTSPQVFIDRRDHDAPQGSPGRERRQFADSREELSPEARMLAGAIDEYKLVHRRRFITYEEMLNVIKSLGYRYTGE